MTPDGIGYYGINGREGGGDIAAIYRLFNRLKSYDISAQHERFDTLRPVYRGTRDDQGRIDKWEWNRTPIGIILCCGYSRTVIITVIM